MNIRTTKEPNQPTEMDEKALTPWQREHLLYMQKQGMTIESETQPKTQESSEEQEEIVDTAEKDLEDVKAVDKHEKERVSFANRLPKLKEYRNHKLFRQLLLMIVIFMIPILFSLYYISPLNNLGKLEIEGSHKTNSDQIIKSSGLKLDERIWPQYLNREGAITKIKESAPRIKEVSIRVTRLNQLVIHVEEYQEVAQSVKNKQYLPVLENGKVLNEPVKKAEPEKVILENFSDEKLILSTLSAYKKLPREIQKAISQVKYAGDKANDQLLNLYMNDGNQVILTIGNMASQMHYYAQVASDLKQKGVIDMEIGIFAYPYKTSETSSSTDGTIQESEVQ